MDPCTFTMSVVLPKKWQPSAHVVVSVGRMSLANDTLVAKPCTRTSGQPGPTAIEHEIGPPADGANCTPTMSVPPGASVDGPPPATTVKSPQFGTTSTISGWEPGLEMRNPDGDEPPTASVPKSSVVSLSTHWAPGACSAPAPFRPTAGMSGPRPSSQFVVPMPLGEYATTTACWPLGGTVNAPPPLWIT